MKKRDIQSVLPKVRGALFGVAAMLAMVFPHTASSYTQSGVATFIGSGVPMGHEWIVRLAAVELLGGDPVLGPDPQDPRKNWTQGKANNLDLSAPGAKNEVARIKRQRFSDARYESTYQVVYDAIVGERWVDIGGFNVTNGTLLPFNHNCFADVSQEPVAVQYDHYMRRYDETGAEGGIQAAERSVARFIAYFVTAAMAPSGTMSVWDGGGYSALTSVDRNYFLLGRALHLLQDSFSSEHTVRVAKDNFVQVKQVKSYLCAGGSEQHTHANKKMFNYTSGDVIWRPGTRMNIGWASYKPSNMKTMPLVTVEASKDLWAAFIRTMGTPIEQRESVARQEATQLANHWLTINTAEAKIWYDNDAHRDDTYVFTDGQSGKGQAQSACLKKLGIASGDQMTQVRKINKVQRVCLYNVLPRPGYEDLFDPALHMPYNWQWRNSLTWAVPPNDWTIPTQAARSGIRVKIKSVKNNQYLTAPSGVKNNRWVYCRAGDPVTFILVGDPDKGFYLRTAEQSSLFLSYREVTGAVKLFDSPKQAEYKLEKVKEGVYAIKNLHWNQYLWVKGDSPYLTGAGNPNEPHSQWVIEGL